MFSSIYCVLFFHVKYFSLVTRGVSRCTYWWTDRRYGCSVSIRQFVVLYSFLLNSHCKIIQLHISSGDRGDVGPPGLPVLGAQEQALQLKGDKGDPGLAGLGGFPGPRGMSQHCRYLPFQLFGSCIYSWWSVAFPFDNICNLSIFCSAVHIWARFAYGCSKFWENSFCSKFCSVDNISSLPSL